MPVFICCCICVCREWEASLLAKDPADAKLQARVRALFHRQLQVPLADSDATMAAYQAWENSLQSGTEVSFDSTGWLLRTPSEFMSRISFSRCKRSSPSSLLCAVGGAARMACSGIPALCLQVPKNVAQGHEKAQAAAALRAASEASVAPAKPADHDLLAAYAAYLRLEKGAEDPARVQVCPLITWRCR